MAYNGMSLEEFLTRYDDNQYLYIGAGSGFFFIGTYAEWKDNYLEVEADEYNFRMDMLRIYNRKYQASKKMYEGANTIKKVPCGMSRESYKEMKRRDMNKRKEALDDYKKKLNAYIPFSKREVIDNYKRKMVKPFGEIIRLNGGSYKCMWFKGDDEKEVNNVE